MDKELQHRENQYLKAYHALYKIGTQLYGEIQELASPESVRFSQQTLKPFLTILEKWRASPGYNPKRSSIHASPEILAKLPFLRQQQAKDVARITGLPQRELVEYQAARGAQGLYDLTFAVAEFPHKAWIELYFKLLSIPTPEQNFLQTFPLSEPLTPLERSREQYYQAGQQFMASKDRLFTTIECLFQEERDPFKKNYFLVKRTIYCCIAEGAGIVGDYGKSTGKYPVHDIHDGFLTQVAEVLAQELHVDLADLVYIYRARDEYGLHELLRQCHWLREHQKILERFRNAVLQIKGYRKEE